MFTLSMMLYMPPPMLRVHPMQPLITQQGINARSLVLRQMPIRAAHITIDY